MVWMLFYVFLTAGNQSSWNQNRASWSPSESPTRKTGGSDNDDSGDPQYEFHDDTGGDDSENNTSNSNTPSSATGRSNNKSLKQVKPIGRRITEEKIESFPQPRVLSDTSVAKPEPEVLQSPARVGVDRDLMADFSDAGSVMDASGKNKLDSKSQDDWADFAGANNGGKIDSSPDDFIEGLTKLTFTKSFKPPNSG